VPRSGLGGPSGRWVYGGSWQRALAIGVLLSWGAMNLIAFLIERRTEMLLHPGGQYKAFYFGDSICLPGIVWGIWYLGRRMPEPSSTHRRWWNDLTHQRWWHVLWFAAGLAYGITWHWIDARSHFYTRSQEQSPTKLYHDFVVFPLYIYITFPQAIPALFKSKAGLRWKLLVVVLFLVFLGLNAYDGNHRPHHGHENFNWSRFWHRIEPG
jgi:hypothetical protein